VGLFVGSNERGSTLRAWRPVSGYIDRMWFALALAAGTMQTVRNALARSLTGRVAPAVNAWARFAFNVPFSGALVLALGMRNGFPSTSARFFFLSGLTALTQVIGYGSLVLAFERSGFAQSIVLHKLEVVFTAVLGTLLFDEHPSAMGWGGVLLTGFGVMGMNLGGSGGPSGWRRAFHLDRGALLAINCGLFFVFTSFALKEAIAELCALNPSFGSARFEAAAHTVFHTAWIQVVLTSLLVASRRLADFRVVAEQLPRMAMIGFVGFAGSLCWFWAYSLTLVAYVKAVGQIEAVLAVGLALVVWKERSVLRQLPGVALVVAGILLVLLG